jgi:hypothetical protein
MKKDKRKKISSVCSLKIARYYYYYYYYYYY